MAQMSFRASGRPTSLHEATRPRSRAPEHPGDAPIALPEPPRVPWSLESYPYPDPRLAENTAAAEAPAAATETHGPAGSRRRRRRRPDGEGQQ